MAGLAIRAGRSVMTARGVFRLTMVGGRVCADVESVFKSFGLPNFTARLLTRRLENAGEILNVASAPALAEAVAAALDSAAACGVAPGAPRAFRRAVAMFAAQHAAAVLQFEDAREARGEGG